MKVYLAFEWKNIENNYQDYLLGVFSSLEKALELSQVDYVEEICINKHIDSLVDSLDTKVVWERKNYLEKDSKNEN